MYIGVNQSIKTHSMLEKKQIMKKFRKNFHILSVTELFILVFEDELFNSIIFIIDLLN